MHDERATTASVDETVTPNGAAQGGGEGDLAAELTTARAKAEENYNKFLYAMADFENYKKRIQRLQEEQSARAASALVTKLLPVLDTLDLAQAHQGAESDDAKALTASRSMLLDVLVKEGLERLDEAAVPFDPAVHDAVAHTDGDGEKPVIDEVLRAGYRWRGQVLRPAMVSVKG